MHEVQLLFFFHFVDLLWSSVTLRLSKSFLNQNSLKYKIKNECSRIILGACEQNFKYSIPNIMTSFFSSWVETIFIISVGSWRGINGLVFVTLFWESITNDLKKIILVHWYVFHLKYEFFYILLSLRLDNGLLKHICGSPKLHKEKKFITLPINLFLDDCYHHHKNDLFSSYHSHIFWQKMEQVDSQQIVCSEELPTHSFPPFLAFVALYLHLFFMQL